MSLSPATPLTSDVGRVFIVAERFDHAVRYLELLSIPIGRWIFADNANRLMGYASGATLLVCPTGYRHPEFTEVYDAAKRREFHVLFLDEERTR